MTCESLQLLPSIRDLVRSINDDVVVVVVEK